MILVSACLLGQSTRYDGGHSFCPRTWRALEGRPHLALCPELLGGLSVPREPAAFAGAEPGAEGPCVLAGRARLLTASGRDVTAAYVAGARAVLAAARAAGADEAWLKDRSPSCAWDPEGKNPGGGPGVGVLAALLHEAGLTLREVRVRTGG